MSVDGTKSVLNRAVAVIVSVFASPRVVLPLTVRLPDTTPLITVVTHARTLVPSQNKKAVCPTGTAMPVPPDVFRVMT